MSQRLIFVVVIALASAPASLGAGKTTEFSQQVTRICAGARLFDLPARIEALVLEPDKLKVSADADELTFGVPDCTGGGR